MRRPRILNRRSTAKSRRYATMTPVVLHVRGITVAALGASSDAEVMRHLLAAIDHLDEALHILAPDVTPAEIVAFPRPGPAS